MKVRVFAILLPMLLVVFPIIVPAQDLPVLPQDRNISTGRLDNGISYYVASSTVESGRVDISLVQRTGYSTEDSLSRGSSVVHSIGALATLPRFRTPSPLRYLVSNAVWPSAGGYATVSDDATVFRFRNVPVTQMMEAVDSTLLMIFEMVNAAPGAVGGRYPMGSQAIVIAGDISAPAAIGKLNMLSMLVDRGNQGNSSEIRYEWHPSEQPDIRQLPPPAPMLGTFSLTWCSPRTPREQMPTIQPLVSNLFFKELAALSEKRLSRAFRDAGIACTGLEAKYVGSAETSGDETFSVQVTVAVRDYRRAAGLTVAVMAGIDNQGVSLSEYKDIDCHVRTGIALTGGSSVQTNAEYTDRCISSFMYGSSLSTDRSKAEYLTGKAVDANTYLRLFNDFSTAILDGSRNLVVESKADAMLLPEPDIRNLLASWDQAVPVAAPLTSQSDTLSLTWPAPRRIKLNEEHPDPMAGGIIFSYSNGMRVIYKKTDSKGVFRYSLNMKGGWSSIPELKPGEGAYVADMLLLGNIGTMSSQRFKDMLSANGIELDVSVTPNDMSIRGSAPSDKLILLLKSLSSLSWKRSPDQEAFTKYCHSLAITHMLEGNASADILMDSLLCPKNRYISRHQDIGLPKNLPVKAETYFGRQFSNMGGSVLIVTGDVPEAAVKRAMLSWLGCFSSGRGSAPRFRSEAVFSTARRSRELPAAASPRLMMGFTSAADFGQKEFVTAGMAVSGIEDAVNRAVVPLGWCCVAKWNLAMFPDERLTLRLDLDQVDYRGLPASLVPEDSVQVVLSKVRAALDRLCDTGVTDRLFAMSRLYYAGNVASWLSDPDYLLRLFELRYNYGKDFVSGIKEKAAQIKKEDVDACLRRLLTEGGSAEIVVPKIFRAAVLNEAVLPEPAAPHIPAVPERVDTTDMSQLLKEVMMQWQTTER